MGTGAASGSCEEEVEAGASENADMGDEDARSDVTEAFGAGDGTMVEGDEGDGDVASASADEVAEPAVERSPMSQRGVLSSCVVS
jgi:hypothetical protein